MLQTRWRTEHWRIAGKQLASHPGSSQTTASTICSLLPSGCNNCFQTLYTASEKAWYTAIDRLLCYARVGISQNSKQDGGGIASGSGLFSSLSSDSQRPLSDTVCSAAWSGCKKACVSIAPAHYDMHAGICMASVLGA